MLVSVIFTFLIVSVSFAQLGDIPINVKGDFTMEEKKASIMALKEVVGKLSIGMINYEVYYIMGGVPTPIPADFLSGFNSITSYSFGCKQDLKLDFFEGNLFAAYNQDKFDLLATEYIAIVANFPIFIDGYEVLTSNPIVTINGKVYVPIEDFVEQLGITITFNEEKQQQKFETTDIAWIIEIVGKLSKAMLKDEVLQQVGKPTYSFDTNVYYSRKTNTLRLNFFDNKLSIAVAKDGFDLLAKELWEAKVLSFPVLINKEEPLTSNPIIAIQNKVYVPIEDLAEQLGITVTFNEEKQQLEITTK